MASNNLFRVSAVGGYDRDEVREYIQLLLDEMETLKKNHEKEKKELLEQIKEMRQYEKHLREEEKKLRDQKEPSETRRMTVGQEPSSEDGWIAKRILEDARRAAAGIREEAELERQKIIREALEEAEEKKKEAAARMNEELEQNGIRLLAARMKIERCAQDVKNTQENLEKMCRAMGRMLEDNTL